jgi:predicted nucleotidyltransferase
METKIRTSERILITLLKEPFIRHSITPLATKLGITRQGLWKSINKLVLENFILIESINSAKTSTSIIKLNWQYPLTEKTLSLLITKESLRYERWAEDFKPLKESVDFLLLFGSILHSPKTADDIDVFAVTCNKNNFKKIDEVTLKLQITQLKKIHLIDMVESEFKQELKKQNKAYLNALKNGILLYGHENFVRFVKKIYP